MALMDKPTAVQGHQRSKPIPVVSAADLEEHRQVPSVKARLERVAALRKVNGNGSESR